MASWTEVADRFRRMKRTLPSEDKPKISPEEALQNDLEDWARQDACQEIFLPHLDRLIVDSERLEDSVIESHAALANQKGITKAWKLLRADFQKWSGQAE